MKYVLSPDIDILDLDSAASTASANTDNGVLQLALRLRKSREQPKSIDIDTARLLSEFSDPTDVSTAILRYSQKTGRHPEETLERAFGAIQSLVNSGFLVDIEEIEWSVKAARELRAGGTFGKYEIVKVIQDVKNEFVLLCRGKSGFIVVKGARSKSGKRRLKMEYLILKHLDGTVSPRVIDYNQSDEIAYVVTDFVPGITVNEYIRQHIPSIPIAQRASARYKTAARILDAYSHLHSKGVMHGDVQPKNMMIRADGTVKLVDFGASYSDLLVETHNVHHAGVTQFFNPKLARARLKGERKKGKILAEDEIFSLGAVIFYLLTGVSYIDFSVDQDEMLEQVSSRSVDTERWRSLGLNDNEIAFFGKIFSAESDECFVSVTEMRAEFIGFSQSSEEVISYVKKSSGLLHFRDEIVGTLLQEEVLYDRVVQSTYSNSNINTGSAGISLGLLRIAEQEHSSDILAAAKVWNTKSESVISPSGYQETIKDRPEIELTGSIFHGPAGTHFVSCLICMSSGDVSGAQKGLSSFAMQGQLVDGEHDVSFGKAGLLVAASRLIIEARKYPDLYEAGFVVDLGDKLYKDVIRHLAMILQDIERGHEVISGFAHGVSGILYSLLAWQIANPTSFGDVVEEALTMFEKSSVPAEFGLAWPRMLNSHRLELLGSWCNGSGGFATTFALLSRLLNDEKSQSLAVEAATHAHATRVQNAADMCCGYTGRAYSQIMLYQVTGEKRWLENAEQLALMAMEAFKDGCMAHRSLYKGHLGLAVLIGDLEFSDDARMPVIGV